MATAFACPYCEEIIGFGPDPALARCLARNNFNSQIKLPDDFVCHGKGKHKKPEIEVRVKFFGCICELRKNYPETKTFSLLQEYVGPRSKYILAVVIIFGTHCKGLKVNGKWALFKWGKLWLHGEGVAELMKK